MNRPLTKSRFKLGIECPTKLFYTNKKNEYADQRLDDPFLQELANGGFQVGELAKEYFKRRAAEGGGAAFEVTEKGYKEPLAKTNELLENEDVTIFEAAVGFENLFIRVDVLRKKGNRFDVIEVKSKSFDSTVEDQFLNKNGTISAGWLPYFYDIGFQKYVVEKAFPGADVHAFLMLSDKGATCPTNGLNQKFRIRKDLNDYRYCEVAVPLTDDDLAGEILGLVEADEICQLIYDNTHKKDGDPMGFEERVHFLAEQYEKDEKIPYDLSKICGDCSFRATPEENAEGLKSGFEECWRERLGFREEDFACPTVLDIWNFLKKDKLLADNRGKMSEVVEDDIGIKPDPKKTGLSRTERQWEQVRSVKEDDHSFFIDTDGLKREFASWKFPLHFIDFETSQAAIPFLKGHRPYEPIAFQFSHHIVEEDCSVRHAGEYVNTQPGVFPNYDFLRALKSQLENDEGTIFRYAPHENTYLCHIWKQLVVWDEPDRDELVDFLKTITKSTGSIADGWEGERNMVDMWDLVKRFYYDPFTNGSTSIKQVLPAVMHSSALLQEKYSKPVYGAEIPSLNFENWMWVQTVDGEIVDPYKLLPKMDLDVSDHDYEILSESDEMGDGGAAMAAYARLQYQDMSDHERSEIRMALLKYCELDTFAMVMIYEAWRGWVED